jgi:hypothetical protein
VRVYAAAEIPRYLDLERPRTFEAEEVRFLRNALLPLRSRPDMDRADVRSGIRERITIIRAVRFTLEALS